MFDDRFHSDKKKIANKFVLQVLCLSPTYELAIQTGEVAAKMSQHRKDIQLRFAVRGEEGKTKSLLSNHLQLKTFYLLQFQER